MSPPPTADTTLMQPPATMWGKTSKVSLHAGKAGEGHVAQSPRKMLCQSPPHAGMYAAVCQPAGGLRGGAAVIVCCSAGTPRFPAAVPANQCRPERQPYELVLSCDLTVYGSGTADGFYQVAAHEDGTFHATTSIMPPGSRSTCAPMPIAPTTGKAAHPGSRRGDQQMLARRL